jgi:hypothetical protein
MTSVKDTNLKKLNPRFFHLLGVFHFAWAGFELTIDCAIAKLGSLKQPDCHLILTGPDMARKRSILKSLVKKSDLAKKDRILNLLATIETGSKRNAFAHSYINFDWAKQQITIVHRTLRDKYDCHQYPFTAAQFDKHVKDLADFSAELQDLLGLSAKELSEFANSAIKAAANS